MTRQTCFISTSSNSYIVHTSHRFLLTDLMQNTSATKYERPLSLRKRGNVVRAENLKILRNSKCVSLALQKLISGEYKIARVDRRDFFGEKICRRRKNCTCISRTLRITWRQFADDVTDKLLNVFKIFWILLARVF